MISGALTVVACFLIRAVNAIELYWQYSVSAVLALFAVAALIFCFWGHKERVQTGPDDDDDDEEEGGMLSMRSLWRSLSNNSQRRAGTFFGFGDKDDHTGASAADGHADTDAQETVSANDGSAAMGSETTGRRSSRNSWNSLSEVWRSVNDDGAVLGSETIDDGASVASGGGGRRRLASSGFGFLRGASATTATEETSSAEDPQSSTEEMSPVDLQVECAGFFIMAVELE